MPPSKKKALKWLLPLWITAALLLCAGLFAHAQQPETTAPQPAPGQARPANPAEPAPAGARPRGPGGRRRPHRLARGGGAGAQTPQSGIAADSQPASAGEVARQARQEHARHAGPEGRQPAGAGRVHAASRGC